MIYNLGIISERKLNKTDLWEYGISDSTVQSNVFSNAVESKGFV